MSFKINGIHHIEITVTNLQRSKIFYSKLPGFKLVAEYPHFVMFDTKEFKFGLTDHNLNIKTNKFDEMNVGLDHVAFSVSTKKDLVNALSFFEIESIPHGEIKKLSNGTFVLSFRDPDNIQLELAYRA